MILHDVEPRCFLASRKPTSRATLYTLKLLLHVATVSTITDETEAGRLYEEFARPLSHFFCRRVKDLFFCFLRLSFSTTTTTPTTSTTTATSTTSTSTTTN